MILGKIVGKTSTTEFKFSVDVDADKFEYVQVLDRAGNYILCQIVEIERDHGRGIAYCNILGYRDKAGRLRGLKNPPEPGTEVLYADDKFVKKTLGLEKSRNAAFIGTLEGRDKLSVFLDLNKLLTRHVSVLAKTGAGKSYVVGVLLEELLENKVPIVVIDPHGEYSTLKYPNDEDADRLSPVVSRNARAGVLHRIDGDREHRSHDGGVIVDHGMQVQLIQTLTLHGHTDEPPSVLGHEVDCLRRHLLGGHDEIAFVLPILIVHHDDDLALAKLLDGLVDGVQLHRFVASFHLLFKFHRSFVLYFFSTATFKITGQRIRIRLKSPLAQLLLVDPALLLGQKRLDVLGQYVHFQVEPVSGLQLAQISAFQRGGN